MGKRNLLFTTFFIGCFSFNALFACSATDDVNEYGNEGKSCNPDDTCNLPDLICCKNDNAYHGKCVRASLCYSIDFNPNSNGGDLDIVDIEEDEEEVDDDTTTDDFNLKWVSIPEGDFMMGKSINDTRDESDYYVRRELPRHTVHVPAFELMQFEVTNAQYAKFLNTIGNNTCLDKDCVDLENIKFRLTLNIDDTWSVSGSYIDRPITLVTWYGAKAFCEKIGGRLPSEAEWEYAARAETTTNYLCGNQPSCLDDIACWDQSNTLDCCTMGQYEPNSFRLFDMSGNVAEWVEDCEDFDYDRTPTDGSAYYGKKCNDYKQRIVRGGSWSPFENHYDHDPETCLLTSYRDFSYPFSMSTSIGFRCARNLE